MSAEVAVVAEVLRAAMRLLDTLPPTDRQSVIEQLGLGDTVLGRVPAGSISAAVEGVIARHRPIATLPTALFGEPDHAED